MPTDSDVTVEHKESETDEVFVPSLRTRGRHTLSSYVRRDNGGSFASNLPQMAQINQARMSTIPLLHL